MNDTWDEYADGWDTNSDVLAYSNNAFQKLTEVVHLESLDVFDFGCGTGLLTEKISPLAKSIVSIDTSQKMLSVLEGKKIGNVTPICSSLSNLKNFSETGFQSHFDLVVASSVCAFVSDYEDTAHHLKSLLKPKGIFVQWDWYSEDKEPGSGFTNNQMQETLAKVGFQSISISTAFTMPSPDGDAVVLMAVARL
ncbi:MAG: methyltransferase domain-containing protein [SAR324 cluster bacterium]|nr:methyltransferase domain-containing protein [SAR324 cluster bacterium]